MKIVVCIKQVPDVKDIQWTQNNTMKRDGVESIINPCDLYALEFAFEIRKQIPDTKINVITMGPNQAEKVLKQAIALGADDGYLICDKKFSGSDTLATSTTLSAAISKICPDYDLILCGQFASDGDTAQTGVGIAQNLNCNQITYAKEIINVSNEYIIIKKENEDNYESLKSKIPCVICVMENKNKQLTQNTICGQIKAQDKNMSMLTFNDLELEESQCGIKGSPTFVSSVFRPNHTRKCEVVANQDIIAFSNDLINQLREL